MVFEPEGLMDRRLKPPEAAACQLKPFRKDQAASLMKAGSVIVYERNSGEN
jgi:hypothetical protein